MARKGKSWEPRQKKKRIYPLLTVAVLVPVLVILCYIFFHREPQDLLLRDSKTVAEIQSQNDERHDKTTAEKTDSDNENRGTGESTGPDSDNENHGNAESTGPDSDNENRGNAESTGLSTDEENRNKETTENSAPDDRLCGDVKENLEVCFINVGQGDCILISCDSHYALIDGGPDSKGSAIRMFLQKRGIEKLDYIFVTHFDADHIGGLDSVAYKFDCDGIIMPDYSKDTRAYYNLMEIIQSKLIKIIRPAVGEKYYLGDAELTILSPEEGAFEDENDYSIVVSLRYHERTFLFMGDSTEKGELRLLEGAANVKTDVLKVSHHGSGSSSTEEFLKAAGPEYAVISCGKDNDYGHPHAETLERLTQCGAKILRTDELGTITFICDGENIRYYYSQSVQNLFISPACCAVSRCYAA